MTDTITKISGGLEQAFARYGFADTSVEVLRDAAGVSLRTLYKYLPSRADMVLAALEYRHQRYLNHVFDALPDDPEAAIGAILSRVGDWMVRESAHGCLFHAAVAADPGSAPLRNLLQRHKAEVAQMATDATGQRFDETEILLIIEGLTQTWSLKGTAALAAAQGLARALRESGTDPEV